MNTGSFACFVFPHPILLCFLFFYLYLHLYAFFISVFCFFNARLLFLLKLRFLSHKASIFISKLHVHRFDFLLCLSKWIQVRFPSLSSSIFSFFTSICICMHCFIWVFCFFTACSLFLLKLGFSCFVCHCMFIVTSMYTGWFSCFVCQNFNFFVFLSLVFLWPCYIRISWLVFIQWTISNLNKRLQIMEYSAFVCILLHCAFSMFYLWLDVPPVVIMTNRS